MDDQLRQPLTDLTAGSMLRMRDGKGRAIVVFEGRVWITQHDDQRDIVLGGGESFDLDHEGLTLVEAVRDSKLLVVEAGPRDVTDRFDTYALYQQARARRSAMVAAALRRGAMALHAAASRALAQLRTPRPSRRPLTVCTAAH